MDSGRKRILAIDDDPDILEALIVILEDAGYAVTASERGEAVEKLMTDPATAPDLILLDMLISGKNGCDICRLLKDAPTTRAIPIVMISAHPNAAAPVFAAGADAFVIKPFEIDDLLGTIAQYVK